ncbi:hypothetical protein PG994_013491 [Apiospora phragmitis]|uniref:Uncharacterized protein n=1 Tax=Apiospora phragmitis TaxID=2905665 RepID=A0ABR1TBB8_9PEZI
MNNNKGNSGNKGNAGNESDLDGQFVTDGYYIEKASRRSTWTSATPTSATISSISGREEPTKSNKSDAGDDSDFDGQFAIDGHFIENLDGTLSFSQEFMDFCNTHKRHDLDPRLLLPTTNLVRP